ncbi:MAG TPA: Holliday junction resolvase RuvX [Clostridiaceae bacterium]|nr:Holliday junction resolvase RuvX [Clostridiaceae bacterium]
MGIAISDPLRLVARRLETVIRRHGDEPGPVDRIALLCREYDVDTIVVGLPLRTDGKESSIAREAVLFADALREKTELTVELFDERYTSQLASRVMVETGAGKRGKWRNKELIDQLAAEILLQGWLDTQRGGFYGR